MAKETQIINYHTSGTTAPLAENLEFGEIAVGHDNDSPRLFIKKNNDEIAEFVDKAYVDSNKTDVILYDISMLINSGTTGETLGNFGETLVSGEISGETLFYTFIGADTSVTCTEYFNRLLSSCVYLSQSYDEGVVQMKMIFNNMLNDSDGIITLNLHSHMTTVGTDIYDCLIILNFNDKIAHIEWTAWNSDEMHAAKPILINVELTSNTNETGDEITTYQLKRNNKNIKPSDIYDLEKEGYRIEYYSLKGDGTRRIIYLNRAEGQSVETRLNLFYIETDSQNSYFHTPGLTFMNFDANGQIVYNSTKELYVTGRIENLDFVRDIINEDNYLTVSGNSGSSLYSINANVVDIDRAVSANTIPAYADIVVSDGTVRNNMICLGAVSAFEGGVEYYYFGDEEGGFCVKTSDVLVGNALKLNQELQTYSYDNINKVMNPIEGQTLYISAFRYLDKTQALADVLDVKEHLNAKQDKLTAGDGIIISGSVISANVEREDGYIYNYETVAEYEAADDRLLPNVCLIEETNEIKYNKE